MSRAGREKSAGRKGAAKKPSAPAAVIPEPVAPPPEPGPKVPGQRLYDMPYSAPAPRLIKPEIGLHNLVARAGHNAGYEIDLTLLDAPDHRLIRSGLLLAHRVLDGRGEWYLGAPDWVPLLPKELIEPMAQAELSDELADRIRPFRRRAPLGPVAALRCERREFALRDDHGSTLALLRDDKVTVRRGGLTTARYREVMLTPVGPGLDQLQADWLDQCLTFVGATPVARFPRLDRRLGAPATGPTDFPEPEPLGPEAPFAEFVAALVSARLRDLLSRDLAVRGGDASGVAPLLEVAARLRAELAALAPLLDADWTEDLLEDLDWLATKLSVAAPDSTEAGEDVADRLRSERYLALLDRLVAAARAPRTGPRGGEPAGAVLGELVTEVLGRIRRSGDRLSVDAPDRLWEQAWSDGTAFAGVDKVAALVLPRDTRRAERLGDSQRLLSQVHAGRLAADSLLSLVDDLPAGDAFEAGRQYERDRAGLLALRADFVNSWAKTRKKLGL